MLRRTTWKNALGLLSLGLAALATWTPALADGQRLVVRVDEPFVVNGQEYPAGRIVLRSVTRYNPTSVIDEVWAGRECLGMLVAIRQQNPEHSDHDSIIFERDTSGRLVLVGYVLGTEGAVYRYGTPAADAGAAMGLRAGL